MKIVTPRIDMKIVMKIVMREQKRTNSKILSNMNNV